MHALAIIIFFSGFLYSMNQIEVPDSLASSASTSIILNVSLCQFCNNTLERWIPMTYLRHLFDSHQDAFITEVLHKSKEKIYKNRHCKNYYPLLKAYLFKDKAGKEISFRFCYECNHLIRFSTSTHVCRKDKDIMTKCPDCHVLFDGWSGIMHHLSRSHIENILQCVKDPHSTDVLGITYKGVSFYICPFAKKISTDKYSLVYRIKKLLNQEKNEKIVINNPNKNAISFLLNPS